MTGAVGSRWAAWGLAGLALVTALVLPSAAATRTVRVGSYYFEDQRVGDSQVVVTQGDRITFTFEGKEQHTATVDGMFTSGVKSPGQRYTTPVLTRVGTFTLYCQVHGARQHGTALIVRRKPAPSPSPSKPRRSPSPPPKTPSPRASTPAPSPTPTSSSSPRPSPTPSPRPVVARPSAVPSPTTSPTTSPTPDGLASTPPDVIPAGPLDDSGPGWLLPAAVAASILLLGAGVVARRRRQRF